MTKRARLALLIAGITLAALAAAGARAADPTDLILSYRCDPPLPGSAANCAIWHTTTVNLRWTYDSAYVPVPGSHCDTTTIDQDTPGTNVTCAVENQTSTQVSKTVTLRVDKTPPRVTGATPDRPPDYDGWWNHPVGLAFGGTDALSGIAGCDTVTYSGPDSDSAQVSGTCRDAAGNSAAGTWAIKYDATPPAITPGSSTAATGHNTLNWTTSPDTVFTSVVRSPGIGGAPASQVYAGPAQSFTDVAVRGGVRYTYTLGATDPAGNVASAVMAVTARPSPQPAQDARKHPPRLDWRSVKGADYYNVQLFRSGRKILSAWPRFSRLQLRRSWTFRGRKHTLAAGIYHWYVWPGYGPRSAHRYGKLIAHRRFTIPKK